jgi:hypothetical protein
MHEETLSDVISSPFGLGLDEKEVMRQVTKNAEEYVQEEIQEAYLKGAEDMASMIRYKSQHSSEAVINIDMVNEKIDACLEEMGKGKR